MAGVRDVAGVILLPLVIVGGLASAALVQARVADTSLKLQCQTAQANITQLQALRQISIELGIPGDFTIPKMPPECVDTSP